jgi:hypothetical protein
MPKQKPLSIIWIDKQMTFIYTQISKPRQTIIHQLASNSLPPEIRHYRKVVKIAPPTVMTAQDSANYLTLIFRHRTQQWVTAKIA